jgi:hypothetical protein
LKFSICGGNIPMMVNKFVIIFIQLTDHATCMTTMQS